MIAVLQGGFVELSVVMEGGTAKGMWFHRLDAGTEVTYRRRSHSTLSAMDEQRAGWREAEAPV